MRASSQEYDAGVTRPRPVVRGAAARDAAPQLRPVASVGRMSRWLYCDGCGHKRAACICDERRAA